MRPSEQLPTYCGREEIERLVRGVIAEGVTAIDDILVAQFPDLKHTANCFRLHREYAQTRLQWETEKRQDWKTDIYDLPAWGLMNNIGSRAFDLRLRRKAIQELMNKTGVIPVTVGSWCVSVRNNDHDNVDSSAAIVVDTMGSTMYEYTRHRFLATRVQVAEDWKKSDSCNFRTTVKKKLGRGRLSTGTPVQAMLMIGIRACFKCMDEC